MIKTDSIKYQLLEMVGLCGEFPSGQLNRLIESDSYAEKVVTDLKQSKLIRTHYKDGLRGYRLTKREYYGAAEPPVRCGESHLSGLTEPPHFVY